MPRVAQSAADGDVAYSDAALRVITPVSRSLRSANATLPAAVMADITSRRNLNPARRHRSYPRVIRRARHNSYRVKRPGDTGTRYHGPLTIKLVSLPATGMINLG